MASGRKASVDQEWLDIDMFESVGGDKEQSVQISG